MGGNDIRRHIVGRMLYRRKGVDILPHRQYHDTARMLAGAPADSRASRHDAVDLTDTLMPAPLLIIVPHITEGRLVRQRTDGPGPVSLAAAENHLRVFVRLTLIFAGKVQVDIRLLIPLKTEEGLERDIKSFLVKRRAALRTILIRHIASRAAAVSPHFLGIKIIIVALWAQVMRAQGIYLRDPRHIGHKRASHGTAGTHQITVLHRFPHQLLGDNIHHRKPVGDDGVQLLLQPVLHDLRQRLPVQLMCPVVTDLRQLPVTVLDHRRALVRPYRRHGLDHIRDQVGVGDDHLLGLIASQIGELQKHLLRRPKIQRRLVIRIRESLSRHDDAAVDLILRIQEMHVTGSRHRLVELFPQPHDLPVDLHDIFHGIYILHPLGLDHELVVAKRLDLQIIIEIHKSGDLRIRLPLQKRTIKLPRLAGAAHDQPFPVLIQKALRNPRPSGKISQMGQGDQPIQVHPSHIVFGQDDAVIGGQFLYNAGT